MEEGTRIIKLGAGQTAREVSFEEAFGEFSEARGRGAAKRAQKQAARVERKTARKVGRQTAKAAKQAVKQERKQAKVAAKQERKVTRVAGRQDKRNVRAENRVGRKDFRFASRQQRRGSDDVIPEEELGAADQQGMTNDVNDQNYGSNQSYSQPESRGYSEPEALEEEIVEESTGSDQYEEPLEDGGYNESGEEDGGYEEEGYDEEESGADGSGVANPHLSEIDGETFDTGFSIESSDADGASSELNERLHNNRKIVAQLQDRKAALRSKLNTRIPDGERIQIINMLKGIDVKIQERINRIADLTTSGIDGIRARKRSRVHQNLTTVESGLGADIQKGRIEVPAEQASNANGTENYALDNGHEVGSPSNRVISVNTTESSFLGDVKVGQKKVKVTSILIVLAAAGTLFYVAKKAKLF